MGRVRPVIARLAVALLAVGMLPAATSAAEPNQPPVAVDDPGPACNPGGFGGSYPIPEDPIEPMVIAIQCAPMLNDSDPDGDVMTPELVTDASHGAATIAGVSDDFNWATYMPDDDYSTGPGDVPGGAWVSDSFTYRVTDGQAWSNAATYRLWVAPINDPPTFTPGPSLVVGTVDGGAHSSQWATNIDPGPGEDNQDVHFEVVHVDVSGVPNLFSVPPAIDDDGVLTFTPGPGEIGLAQVTVQAVDDGGVEDWDVPSGMLREQPDDTSDLVTFEIVVAEAASDTTAPTIGSLARSLPAQAIGTSSVKVNLSWKGTDAGTGIASYRLERRLGSGAWTKVTLPTPTTRSITATLTIDTAYTYRVRATDVAGNVGAWATFPTLNPKRIQDTSSLVAYTGTWTKVTNSSLSGGSARYASSTTRRAKVSFTGQEIALIATRRTTGGRAEIRVDGVVVGTVDLDASSTQYRRLVFRKGFAGSGPHTLEVRPLGDGRVEIDAFIVLR